MKKLEVTAVDVARRFIGIKEVKGRIHNPHILSMLQLDNSWAQDDETPWCSAFVNYICWLLDLPRSKSLAARSWLLVGKEITRKQDALIGFDVVVTKRGQEPQPDATVIAAPGHVGFFYGFLNNQVHLLSGNQGDMVSIAGYPIEQMIGIRRIFG